MSGRNESNDVPICAASCWYRALLNRPLELHEETCSRAACTMYNWPMSVDIWSGTLRYRDFSPLSVPMALVTPDATESAEPTMLRMDMGSIFDHRV